MQREELDYITRCLRWLANVVVAEDKQGKLSPLMHEKLCKFVQSVGRDIDLYTLTREDFLTLGFMCYGYEDDDPYELWLIPVWMYDLIPDLMELEDIEHNKFIFNKKTAPCEPFYGCLQYGLRINNPSYKIDLDEILSEESIHD